jgi:mannose-6-phosphate isomerase
MWMGIHHEGPSEIRRGEGTLSLGALIAQDPLRYLGQKTFSAFGTLPFLFKALGIEKPLSLQAHPNRAQARAGWERENRQGIPQGHPDRNYKDPNHKPELFCALSPSRLLAGFREGPAISEAALRFAALSPAPVRRALEAAEAALRQQGARAFFASLHEPSFYEAWARWEKPPEQGGLVSDLMARYPLDPAALAPLYLNTLGLGAGEAVYIPPGALHCYLSGFGLELMANSDNVLRGGLTTKQVDREELMRVLDFTPFVPEVLSLSESAGAYPARYPEFSLQRLADCPRLPVTGPVIALMTRGEAAITYRGETCGLRQGESVFIPPSGDALLQGHYTLYAAGVP